LFSSRATLPSLISKTCSKAASSSAPLFGRVVAEERPPVYFGSAAEHRRWTDELLDDLAEAVRTGLSV
jgi:hypothetical protein